jgi:GT2 family glycosyltransferase
MKSVLSVIIVNYRAEADVVRLQRELRDDRLEIIVIDNSDGQHGYGAGCNAGAHQAQGKYLAFLNPDIEVNVADLMKMTDILADQPAIGLVGPQIRRPDGQIEITCSAIPTPWLAWWEYSWFGQLPFFSGLRRPYRLFGFDHQSSRPVPSVAGSCLVMRQSDWVKVGGFDEQLFLYFEEFDLASRLADLGLSVYFAAEAKIIHYGQVSTKQIGKQATVYFRQSRRYWFHKRYGRTGDLVVWLLEQMETKHD